MNWYEVAKNYQEEYVDLTKKLLKIPTVLENFNPKNENAPFGKEIKKALDFMLKTGEKDGFIVKNVDNYAGHIEMGEGEEVLGILGHLDVVPAGGKWHNPPFSAYEANGKIYARGAMDDKGPTIAAYIAMKMVKDKGIKLNKKVRLILGCDEETGMRGVRRYLEKEQMPDIGFAPDAEFPLIYAEKGIYSFNLEGKFEDDLIASLEAGERYNVVPDECTVVLKVNKQKEFIKFLQDTKTHGRVYKNTYTVFGKNAHAAWPHLGNNAIYLMVNFLKDHTDNPLIHFIDKYLSADHLGKKLGIDTYDKEMKELTMNTGFVHYDGNNAKLGINIRYPRNYEFEKGEEKIIKAAETSKLKYISMGNSKPHYVSPEDELVKSLHEAYMKYTGDQDSKIMSIGGGTYARILKKAVAFGPNLPGNEDLAHQPNEYLIIKDMIIAASIYAESIIMLAGE
ncbi:MAG: dipeptidase PepV [Candidatus Izemoplasmatales bacterium]